MELVSEQRILASRERVYAALNDPAILQQCIPGCESLDKVSDTEMTATVTLRVGPVTAKFKGRVTLSNLSPPESYTITGEGTGGAAGFAKGSAAIRLVEEGDATLLRYEVRADVGGRLAQMGGRLIDSTARALAGRFFEEFRARVESAGATKTPAGEAAPIHEAPPMVAMGRAANQNRRNALIWLAAGAALVVAVVVLLALVW